LSCENRCELAVEPATLLPALPCARLETLPQECDCAILISLRNTCAGTLEAVDFSFRSCIFDGKGEQGCTRVEPDGQASLFLPLKQLGKAEFSHTVHSAEGDHVLSVRGNVSSFGDDGPGCRVSSAGTEPGFAAPPVFGLLAVTWLFALRRRRVP